mmetsp:Transcript_58835/g.104595  ORF Transcript_58835/g.104595 Transcript_58835/m.104595 type:complete len:140 (+) Transcript_58835:72-491(+)|eukprot:CAMPEP_0197623122 /NCGR_PEP_ID=MMETSP1338-20131121/3191_1 /TAXON_ID=43686 ORGANISM="Pelagodinium beii, Strain RCC1491" /NCGR_SAMPLE_ID=MMETSP1338 /ASSEMBLY_ACC=CAM_ASM_000754 /LENGTH=139 /DNA_ID=CAMNT_0043192989 /DNA_START=72 /DNA_END=491 /DNA_ORIENTATION=+
MGNAESVCGEMGPHASIEDLEQAVRAGDVDRVKLLVARGVNVNEGLDSKKGTVFDVLMDEHNQKLVALSKHVSPTKGFKRIDGREAQRLFDEQHARTKAIYEALEQPSQKKKVEPYPVLLAAQTSSKARAKTIDILVER